jgi:phosphomannomutase
LTLSQLFALLPKRYSCAALIKQFPRDISLKIIKRYSPADARISEAAFKPEGILFSDAQGNAMTGLDADIQAVQMIADQLTVFFAPELGFSGIGKLNYIDGVRIYFSNGEVAHLRPSGNADELRIYAVADNQERANAITQMAVVEPEGILRRLALSVN